MVQAGSFTPVQQKLLNSYQQLSATRQRVLQLFAIAYTPVARSKVLECLHHAGIVDDDGNRLNSSRLKKHIDSLLSLGLVLQQQLNISPQCRSQIAEIVTRIAVVEGQFGEMAEAIQSVIPISQLNDKNFPRRFETNEHFLREFRIALYRDRFDLIEELLEEYYKNSYLSRHLEKLAMKDIVLLVFNNPFDPEWFARLPHPWHDDSLATILTEAELSLFAA
ncbi:MAG: hypothetical protein F6K30_21635, partial [Cyanothece sp. SIO2G6]|nr:hypothetical protein [Cyanothece sp. SIO2G6]